MTALTVIIPNFNGEHLLKQCLSALKATDTSGVELDIIIVDNGSEDNSIDLINKFSKDITVIANSENLGFAEACNQGAVKAEGDYILFLNNDTKVEKNWLQALLEGIDEESNIICTSSKIVGWDEDKVEFGGGEINFCGYGFQRASFKEKYMPLESPSLIPFACGCSMLIKRDVFIECGMFDKDFFAFYEDVDLGWRLNILGYKTLYCPHSVVQHRHHATAKKLNEGFLYYLWSRNALVSVLKNYEDKLVSKVFTAAFLLTFERFIYISGLRKKAVELDMQDEAERYLDIEEGIGKAFLYLFENIDGILEKRNTVQRKRTVSDRQLAEQFELKIEFDDITNAKVENILSSHLVKCFDFSDIFRKGKEKEHLLDTMNTLKKSYKEKLNLAINLEHKCNLLEHRVEHLEKREEELSVYNQLLLGEMEEIKNSRTFRILEKVRAISNIFKRGK